MLIEVHSLLTAKVEFSHVESVNSDILLFDAKSGKYMSTLKGHTNAVNTVSFSSDGTMLASASNDGTVRVIGIQEQKNTSAHLM